MAPSLLRPGVMGGSRSVENRVSLHPECHNRVHNQRIAVSKPRLRWGAFEGLELGEDGTDSWSETLKHMWIPGMMKAQSAAISRCKPGMGKFSRDRRRLTRQRRAVTHYRRLSKLR
jgi:hypothetical protein